MGKGSKPRPVDRKKWDSCPLWDNLKDNIDDYCPDCGGDWAEHEFGVPYPYCPQPKKTINPNEIQASFKNQSKFSSAQPK